MKDQDELIEILRVNLDIPKEYLICKEERICVTTHRQWVTGLTNLDPIDFITHEYLSLDEIAAQPSLEELGMDWCRIYIKVYKKRHKNVFILPRERSSLHRCKTDYELSFSQVLHYVDKTNYQNLWKEYYKKHFAPWTSFDWREANSIVGCTNETDLLKEIINRMYGCAIIKLQNKKMTIVKAAVADWNHCNLLPAIIALEIESAFLILYDQTAKYSLRECVTYSPASISTSYAKPLFLTYQLLRLSRDLHDCGLLLGEITLSDILIMDDLTLQVLPNLNGNIYVSQEAIDGKNRDDGKRNCGSDCDLNIINVCEKWVHGQLSNFDYLTALNNLAGRRFGDPSCHHVMPWVTDFASRNGENWRDFTKSKFRLNKGDRQLDLTFNPGSAQVGYHVSDVLSEITYYVYLSRRYSRSLLCKHVRPLWVPGEYPASIQRLYEWTPDECIPQFFTDPNVFKSIHEDLPDLEIPNWATSPEDFIRKHRESLESAYVSERLHHWIDLTFGYKLSGPASIKSKNVCLHLVDNHTNLLNSGVVQLFTSPHPQKISQTSYWNRVPPRLRNFAVEEKFTSSSDELVSKTGNEESRSSGEDEEDLNATSLSNAMRSPPLMFTRLLSRSRSSLPLVDDNVKPEKANEQSILLPKDYNPASALLHVEMTHAFMNRVAHDAYKPKMSNDISTNQKQILAAARLKELQIMGCLIVEIFHAEKFRAIWKVEQGSFASRLNATLNLIKTSQNILPKCVQNTVMLLLRIDAFPKSYSIEHADTEDHLGDFSLDSTSATLRLQPTITRMGLPPPSAHQILQPVLSGLLLPSSRYMQYLYGVVEMIQEYNNLSRELDRVILTFNRDEYAEATRIIFLCKINECKVKAIANELEKLVVNSGVASETSLQLIVPHVRHIFEQPLSSVLAAWHLFDPIARAMGPRQAASVFLAPLIKLFDKGSLMDGLAFVDTLPHNLVTKFKTIRLYHRSFLLKLMVRLGLKCFLENFTTPLVEAAGGCRNHSSRFYDTKLDGVVTLQDCDLLGSNDDVNAILSPLDDDSSASNVMKHSNSRADFLSDSNEVIFEMETEDSVPSSPYVPTMPRSLHFEFNEETEDFSCETKTTLSSSAKSPMIPIPMSLDVSSGRSVPEFNSICCKVGSTTTSEDIPFPDFLTEDGTSKEETGSTTQEEVFPSAEQESSFVYVQKDSEGLACAKEVHTKEPKSQQKRRLTYSECTASEMSAESVIWLSHRLGPVLTSRYLSRNLLRMLTLCYSSKENLIPSSDPNSLKPDSIESNRLKLSGDANAAKVLECLSSIVGLYGEQTIVRQYLSHTTELVAQCKRKLTSNLEGGLVSCLVLLIHMIPYLSDSSLMDVINDGIVKSILLPTVRIVSTSKFTFPNGATARFVLANKYLETLLILIVRLGNVMARNHLTTPIQRFFVAFEKAFNTETVDRNDESITDTDLEIGSQRNSERSRSGLNTSGYVAMEDASNHKKCQAFEELREVFSASLAHKTYVALYRLLNDDFMDDLIKSHQLVRDLFHEFEQELLFPASSSIPSENRKFLDCNAKGFGKVSTIGNQIKIQKNLVADRSQTTDHESSSVRESSPFLNAGRQLKGNWLAYWEHEIGRSDKDTKLNIKQIKLQTFAGHTNTVRCLDVLDNENSFMSGARDRTVKLWSLRSQGDGSAVSSCQYTYNGHKRSIIAATFLESLRYAVTCDGNIHCWDPFMGSFLGCPESPRPTTVNVLVASPAPSSTILVGTADITLRVIDCRTFQYVNEMKLSMNPAGLVRCIAVAPSGNWTALGQATGFLTIMDTRTGLIIASWKGHECEILQLKAVNETTIISSSLDQTIAVWSAVDGKLKFHLKGVTEPVHCLAVFEQQLVSGTTANRIGVHPALGKSDSYSFSKLRQDAFKGMLTTMALLPLNRLLILGADNGNINLIC
ncbi:hypothetical protein QAD02_016237 [Eretmocerus hayati]|uniref:Uncharacterized protein n=1 Tax=Eretmocerus hayati TaxID=131215 RepID=A0ACC2PAL6_9HYME|nr:hypothetical protein QAD02_016237 [Eretmocerus hayati]